MPELTPQQDELAAFIWSGWEQIKRVEGISYQDAKKHASWQGMVKDAQTTAIFLLKSGRVVPEHHATFDTRSYVAVDVDHLRDAFDTLTDADDGWGAELVWGMIGDILRDNGFDPDDRGDNDNGADEE